jgi:hypothetical protein
LRDGERERRRGQRRPWYQTTIAVLSAVATVALLTVVVEHRLAGLPKTSDCPAVAIVNRALGTRVATASSVSENDLLGCFYAQGSDAQAVTVSFAVPGALARDPCRHRRPITVSRHKACDVTGSRGTGGAGRSLLVEASLQDQFSSHLRPVGMAQLEALASRVLAMAPPPVRADAGQNTGR